MPDSKHLQHHINSGFIRVVTDTDTHIPAFWAHPTTGGPFPGLILLHDDWGLGAATRAAAHRFAEIGYYVIVPDLFEGHRATSQPEADELENRFRPLATPKVAAGLNALETHPKCNSKLAVVGWDLGAELALQLALERHDVMATVAVSGDATEFMGHLDDLQCPLLVILGDEDEITRRTENLLRSELAMVDDCHQIVVYEDASHAFHNHLTPSYHAEAAEDAMQKILGFLETYQGKPPAPEEAAPGFFRPGRVY